MKWRKYRLKARDRAYLRALLKALLMSPRGKPHDEKEEDHLVLAWSQAVARLRVPGARDLSDDITPAQRLWDRLAREIEKDSDYS